MLKNTRRKLVIFIDMFRFSFDFAPKRVGDLIRFLSVKLTTGSRILEIVGLHAVGSNSWAPTGS